MKLNYGQLKPHHAVNCQQKKEGRRKKEEGRDKKALVILKNRKNIYVFPGQLSTLNSQLSTLNCIKLFLLPNS
ncbi:MAG: hypothetical protein ACRC62_02405 [Microcoleus sp.]